MKKTLHLNRTLHAVLVALMLGFIGMGEGHAQRIVNYTYDFSDVCPSGQTLYYRITDAENRYVEIVPPGYVEYESDEVIITPWTGHSVNVVGELVIPGQVQGYTVKGFRGWTFYYPNGYEYVHSYCGAFSGSTELTSIVFPSTLTSIGGSAFSGCTSLTTVDIPNSVTSLLDAFSGCTSLSSVIIPNSVTTISGTFYGCTGLKSVEIPNSVTKMSNSFSGCTGLTEINIPNSVTSISGDFNNCTNLTSINIPNSVTFIGQKTFSNCVGLTSIIIPNTVTQFGRTEHRHYNGHTETIYSGNTFQGCTNLTSIVIPNSLTYIGEGTFSGCTGLTSITIPTSVDSIIGEAFKDCINLSEVNFDAINCSYMGGSNDVFAGCTSLKTVKIGNQVRVIPRMAFYHSVFAGEWDLEIPNSVETIGENAFAGCDFASISIGESVSKIGLNAFKGCNNVHSLSYKATNCTASIEYNGSVFNCAALTTLSIGENVQTIPEGFVRGCGNLTSVTIPNSVTTIGPNAFTGCDALSSVIIPKNISSIGKAFSGCSRLTTVYWNAENASGISVFSGCPNLTTLHIGSDVREIGTNIFKGSTGVHLVVAMGPTPATLVGNAFADFADNSILQVSCNKRMTYYAVWNMFSFDHIIEDCSEYPVSMDNTSSGGSVTTSTPNAQMGEVVTLTVTPNPGMHLTSLTVCNASDPTQVVPVTPVGGKASFTYSFTMPPFGVVVTAAFATGTSVGEINSSIPAAVYPNPTNGKVTIEASDLRHVSIFNAIGQQVYDSQADGDAFECDLSRHEPGVYLIRLETANGIATKRVVLSK